MQPQEAPTTDDIREYEFARGQGYEGTFQDFMLESRRAGATTVTVGGQEGARLGAIPQGMVAVPDEAEPSGFRLEPMTNSPAQAAAASEAKVEAETRAETLASARDSINLVLDVMNDPNLDAVTGMIQGRLPARTQAQQDLLVRIEQLQGQAFLQAFETLKGGGTITEREGAAAQAAIARLQREQSGPAYREALSELATIMNRAIERSGGQPLPIPGAAGAATDFSQMSRQDLASVDTSALSDEELDAYLAALRSIAGGGQ
jgi:hypothetical protein